MSIEQKLNKIAENVPKVYESGVAQGRSEEWNEFWDNFQDYGKRYQYIYAFSYSWNNNIFKPKYDIRPVGADGANHMFYNNQNELDIAEGLAYNGVKIDLSQATRLNSTYDRCNVKNIPPIDARSCTTMNMTFYNNKADKITINNLREDCTFDRVFNYCYNLVDLVITGIIGNNVTFIEDTKLSKASIKNIITCLSDNTSGKTLSLPQTAVNKAFTTDEWNALVATKPNWTISLI